MDSNLRVVAEANRQLDGSIVLKAKFSNNSVMAIGDLTFQMAVTKVLLPPYLLHCLEHVTDGSGGNRHTPS